jgi:hypothetical protein
LQGSSDVVANGWIAVNTVPLVNDLVLDAVGTESHKSVFCFEVCSAATSPSSVPISVSTISRRPSKLAISDSYLVVIGTYVAAAVVEFNFVPSCVLTVVAKFGSAPSAALSSLSVFNVSGAL